MQEQPNGRSLYTVLLEYEGLSSVSQFLASSADEAIREWFSAIGDGEPYALTRKQARKLVKAFAERKEEAELVPLRGLRGAWCTTFSTGKSLALFNVVATATSPQW